MAEEGVDDIALPLYTGSVIRFCVHKTEYITVKESNSRKLATVTGEQESMERGSSLNGAGIWANGGAAGGVGGQGSADNVLPRSRSRSSSFSKIDVKTSLTQLYAPLESAMKIIGRINDIGLGLPDWWSNQDQ